MAKEKAGFCPAFEKNGLNEKSAYFKLGRLDVVELREVLFQEGVPLCLDGTLGAGGAFAVTLEEAVDHVHSLADFAEGSEALAVEKAVIAVVDEELDGAGVGSAGFGEGDFAGCIRDFGFAVIFDVSVLPDFVDGGVAVDSELNHEAVNSAEEGDIVEVTDFDKVVETVSAERRPVAIGGDFERALGGVEDGGELFRCFFSGLGRVLHGWVGTFGISFRCGSIFFGCRRRFVFSVQARGQKEEGEEWSD